jgi:chromosome partitioning protein
MKVITPNSPKGGPGKSTSSIILINSLSAINRKVLAIDSDTVNHSLSSYYNEQYGLDEILAKNVFNVFSGKAVKDNVLSVRKNLDLIHGDVRLIDFRTVEYQKLKHLLKEIENEYDYCIIDTSPDYHNIIVNALYASDILLIPVIPDLFNYQSIKFLINKLYDLELENLEVKIFFNQYEEPRTKNEEAYSNQILQAFYNDEKIASFIVKNHLPKSNYLKKYISTDMKIKNNKTTGKLYQNIISFLSEITGENFSMVEEL